MKQTQPRMTGKTRPIPAGWPLLPIFPGFSTFWVIFPFFAHFWLFLADFPLLADAFKIRVLALRHDPSPPRCKPPRRRGKSPKSIKSLPKHPKTAIFYTGANARTYIAPIFKPNTIRSMMNELTIPALRRDKLKRLIYKAVNAIYQKTRTREKLDAMAVTRRLEIQSGRAAR